MTQPNVNVKLIALKEPCTACLITGDLLRELLAKIQKEQPGLEVEFVILDNLKQVAMVKGLEVPKFPAILINDEQVTAGSLPSKQQLLTMIQAAAG